MRISIAIPKRQIEALAAICEHENASRREIIRRAIASYIEKNTLNPDSAFGLWQNRKTDGLGYQEQVRGEW